MKVLTAMLVSAVCWWLGDCVYRLMCLRDWLSFLYPVYNRLMCWSAGAEDWAGIEFLWGERCGSNYGGTD